MIPMTCVGVKPELSFAAFRSASTATRASMLIPPPIDRTPQILVIELLPHGVIISLAIGR